MAAKKPSPLAQIETLNAQKAAIEKRIAEAQRKHIEALGRIVQKAGLAESDPAFLMGALKEAKRISPNSDRYRELVALGSKP